MKNRILIITGLVVSFAIGFYANSLFEIKPNIEDVKIINTGNQSTMKLGAFSISLNVKNLKASKEFYEKLGFKILAGNMEQNYLIMKNNNALIGLFQGMFQSNILTFNPGWDENADNIEDFDDIRKIQKQLKNSGLTLISEADDTTKGPTSLTLTDPDGNLILLDQHR